MSEASYQVALRIANETPFWQQLSAGLAGISTTNLTIIGVGLIILVVWHLVVLCNLDKYVPSPSNSTKNLDTAMIWNITAAAILIGGLVLVSYNVTSVISTIERSSRNPKGSLFVSTAMLRGLDRPPVPTQVIAEVSTPTTITNLTEGLLQNVAEAASQVTAPVASVAAPVVGPVAAAAGPMGPPAGPMGPPIGPMGPPPGPMGPSM